MKAPRYAGSTQRNLDHYGARLARLWPDHTQREIAKLLGVSQYSVSRWGYELGLVPMHETRPRRKRLQSNGRAPEPIPELYRCCCGGLSTDPDSVDVCTHQQEVA